MYSPDGTNAYGSTDREFEVKGSPGVLGGLKVVKLCSLSYFLFQLECYCTDQFVHQLIIINLLRHLYIGCPGCVV